ncbi:tyrosine-type recombinase/integrase [Gordonia neofelifaecis]|uniref:Integrase n=1 Tax=Gordonia neofelifaecis NRRL B-59395 TaxID=644548 RepID=F1YE44_9ACTN|nr:tyrosine-type recombinase/integrase [Gordonia neofelifaecis]EGD57134.1 integrase [Gordonia neofelifaecis NRRL B-59395]
MAQTTKKKRRRFGQVDALPSGRWRARYKGPDGELHKAPNTFGTEGEADVWLGGVEYLIDRGQWESPAVVAAREAAEAARTSLLLGDYADTWISTRTNKKGKPIAATTAYNYRNLWKAPEPKRPGHRAKPAGKLHVFANTPVAALTPAMVRTWYAEQVGTGSITAAARAYEHLKNVMATAVIDKYADENPCQIRGASRAKTGRKRPLPEDDQLDAILEEMPATLQPLVIIAAYAGLRFGEIVALRAGDITVAYDDEGKVDSVRIRVEEGITYTPDAGRQRGSTKSEAGVRRIAVFGRDAVTLAEFVADMEPDELLFTGQAGKELSHSSFAYHWNRAREAIGRPDLVLHAVRAYHLTEYARAGASLRDLMARGGHSSVSAAMRYQHAAAERDEEIAKRMAR